MRHPRFLRGLAYSASDFVDDHIVVRRVASQQAAQADDGVILFGFGKAARGGRDFERAGDANDFDVFM